MAAKFSNTIRMPIARSHMQSRITAMVSQICSCSSFEQLTNDPGVSRRRHASVHEGAVAKRVLHVDVRFARNEQGDDV